MAFSVKDFWSYTDDPSTLKDLVVLVAKPGGGGFSLINMTKEEFFKIAPTMPLEFQPQAGHNTLIVFDDPNTVTFEYLPANQSAFLQNLLEIGLSANGTTNDVAMAFVSGRGRLIAGRASGPITEGEVLIYDTNGQAVTMRAALAANITARHQDPRNPSSTTVDYKYRQDDLYQRSSALDAGSTDLPTGENSTCISESAGISTHTYNFPANPENGDRIRLTIYGTITTVTMSAPGSTTITGGFTAAGSAFQSRTFIYDAILDRWIRIASS